MDTLHQVGGVAMQVYLKAFAADLNDMRRRVGYLKRTGITTVINGPLAMYAGQDGPYSQVDQFVGDPRFGGDGAIIALNRDLRAAKIFTIGDAVVNHVHSSHPTWRAALAGDHRMRERFRTFTDPVGHRDKVNIFGLDPYRWVEELGAYIAQTFYPDQIEWDVSNPEVQDYLIKLCEHMLDVWEFLGLRLDAIAYAAARILYTVRGEHEPVALRLAEVLRERVIARRPGTVLLAEAGGDRTTIAVWLQTGRCDLAYDFEWGPALICSVLRGDWRPTLESLVHDPAIAEWSRWLRFLRSHDELQLRYSEHREELIDALGGVDHCNVVFGGNGLSQRLRAMMPSLDAHVMALGVTILHDRHMPMVFAGDLEARCGNPLALVQNPDGDPRDEARDPMVWDSEDPRYGWYEAPEQPFAEDAWYAGVKQQLRHPASPLNRTRRFILARTQVPALEHGTRIDLPTGNASIWAPARITPDDGALMVVNASGLRQPGSVDVRLWRTQYVQKLVTDPAAYRNVDELIWESAGWVDWHALDVRLAPWELQIYRIAPRSEAR